MKKVFFILLTVPVVSFSQSKGDSKIIVSVSDTSGLFNKIALALIDNGYTLEQKDRELNYISTLPKKSTKWKPEMKVHVVIKSKKIIFSGFADTKGELGIDGLHSSGTFDPIVFSGKNSLMRDCWNQIVDIAKAFGSVSFSAQ